MYLSIYTRRTPNLGLRRTCLEALGCVGKACIARAGALFDKAAAACAKADDIKSLARQVNACALAPTVRPARSRKKAEKASKTPCNRSNGLEGILELFRDGGWAREAYDGLEQALSDAQAKAMLHTSRKYRLERTL